MDVTPLDLDRQLCFSLYRASRAVTRAYRPLLEELGLTYPQYLVMLVLWQEDGPVGVNDIGARLAESLETALDLADGIATSRTTMSMLRSPSRRLPATEPKRRDESAEWPVRPMTIISALFSLMMSTSVSAIWP